MELQNFLNLCTKSELSQAKRLARQKQLPLLSALNQLLSSIAKQQGIALSQLLESKRTEQLRLQNLAKVRKQEAERRHQDKMAERAIDLNSWNAWFDGSAYPNPGACSIGVLLQAPDGRRWTVSQHVGFGTNSDAEYQALIAALKLALAHEADLITFHGDSRVVLDDVNAPHHQASDHLKVWRQTAQALLQRLPRCKLLWIPRARNWEADQLAAKARK